MGKTLTEKLLSEHLLEGSLTFGSELALKIDQTLTQDATGTMAFLAFEAMGISRVKTERSVAYVDHNLLQSGFQNADDHRYLQSAASKYGVWFSRPGNGICHQVHLERFGIPGKTLLGSDSHTPTAGGLGMLAFGAGGMDVAVAMGGGAYHLTMPKIIRVQLSGTRAAYVSAKDVALELLRRLTVRGGVGAVMEWSGDGILGFSVPERATIANMGTELGATTTVFPSDEVTYRFLRAQGRERDFRPLAADRDCSYDETVTINLSSLTPLIACPSSPDRVVPVSSVKGKKVDQVCIGSCTNSSLRDLKKVAAMLRGRRIPPEVSLSVSPGSQQVLCELADCGALSDLLRAGARILECGCGPCIGMGFSPSSGGVSLRTFNRNFPGRSGTADAEVYLASPEVCAASAVCGVVTDPAEFCAEPVIPEPERYCVDDGGILPPSSEEDGGRASVVRGPNIQPFPEFLPLCDSLTATVLLSLGDNVTTDHILPGGAAVLPYRSNVPKIAQFCFSGCDETFYTRAKSCENGIIVAGENYGQGSSREHAALVPRYLGIRCVIAKSFARIHRANLINAGILPLTFADTEDAALPKRGDELLLSGLFGGLDRGFFCAKDLKSGKILRLCGDFTERQRRILRCGGLLNFTKEGGI